MFAKGPNAAAAPALAQRLLRKVSYLRECVRQQQDERCSPIDAPEYLVVMVVAGPVRPVVELSLYEECFLPEEINQMNRPVVGDHGDNGKQQDSPHVRRAGFEPAETEVAWFTATCI